MRLAAGNGGAALGGGGNDYTLNVEDLMDTTDGLIIDRPRTASG